MRNPRSPLLDDAFHLLQSRLLEVPSGRTTTTSGVSQFVHLVLYFWRPDAWGEFGSKRSVGLIPPETATSALLVNRGRIELLTRAIRNNPGHLHYYRTVAG